MNAEEKINLIKIILKRWDDRKVCPYCGSTLNGFLPETEQIKEFAEDYCKRCDDFFGEFWHDTLLAIIDEVVYDKEHEHEIVVK